MCGRYVLVSEVETVENTFNVQLMPGLSPVSNPNISAGDKGMVITDANPKNIQNFTFGFTPHWAKKQAYILNARSEGDHNSDDVRNFRGSKGIVYKPMFRQSIRKKRCLVLANGFLEGPKIEKLSQPYLVYPEGQELMAFAGIWDEWVDSTNQTQVHSFAILTRAADDVSAAIHHHRSPIVMNPSQYEHWLNPDLELAAVLKTLDVLPDFKLNAYPVSPKIKSPKNKGLGLLQPIGEPIFKSDGFVISQKLTLEGMGESPAKTRRKKGDENQLTLF